MNMNKIHNPHIFPLFLQKKMSLMRTWFKCIIPNRCDRTRNCDIFQRSTWSKYKFPNCFNAFSNVIHSETKKSFFAKCFGKKFAEKLSYTINNRWYDGNFYISKLHLNVITLNLKTTTSNWNAQYTFLTWVWSSSPLAFSFLMDFENLSSLSFTCGSELCSYLKE